MKLYRNLVEGVIQSLEKIFNENRYADKVIEYLFKEQKKWGARDRRFVAETIYDVVRWYRLLNELAPEKDNRWQICGVYFMSKEIALPDWPEFKGLNNADASKKLASFKNNKAVLQSIPDWLYELGLSELPEKWNNELIALNTQAQVVLRTNTLKTSAQKLQKELLQEHVETHRIDACPDALVLDERKNIFTSQLFKHGQFEIQDASSQQVAAFMQLEPGMNVIDACAGAGGKTLHIAALMQNKGKITALDIEERKLEELKRRATRASATTIETKVISSPEVIKKLEKTADRLLLDVPCSGLGVLKRNPDAKWKLSLQQIEEVKQKQQTILRDYTCMLKTGGLMVYATCSILPSENQGQVKLFLDQNKNFTFVKEKTIMPSEGFDGFYMCLIKREK